MNDVLQLILVEGLRGRKWREQWKFPVVNSCQVINVGTGGHGSRFTHASAHNSLLGLQHLLGTPIAYDVVESGDHIFLA